VELSICRKTSEHYQRGKKMADNIRDTDAHRITDSDLKLIACLRGNARMSIARASIDLNQPAPLLLSRLMELEDSGIITGYTSHIDFRKLDFNLHVSFALGAEKKDLLENYLQSHPNVNSVFRLDSALNPGFDFLADVFFKDMKSMYNFIEGLEEFKISNINEHHIVDELKKEVFIPQGNTEISYPQHLDDPEG
jgi:DNA-binding Lrp family transcriptional regulator